MEKSDYKKLPDTPGVYMFQDAKKKILYIGKAGNLKRRVSSYFERPRDNRIEKMTGEAQTIDYKKTESALEALILEAKLIKKYQPPYNILQKDDKSFLYVEITNETFPRVLLIRGKELQVKSNKNQFGPFIYAGAIREGLRILRKIFPWSLHDTAHVGTMTRACFDHQVGLCPGTCVGAISKQEYKKIVRKVKLFFQGKKKQIIRELEREMKEASKNLEFERANIIKRQIFSLKHIQDIALINASFTRHSDPALAGEESQRIEGYDISNISGTSAVGSMVVFVGNMPDKNEYRKFKIYSVKGSDDTGMLREVVTRRLKHNEWKLPDLMLIDGGKGQVNTAKSILAEQGLKIPTIGIAKGPKRKKNEFIGRIPEWASENTLIRVRDEAHRFAITYHKKLRARTLNPIRQLAD
ncbi:MAG: excinuclease ABC subunit UvrC [bacterium]|nr:excinuclease ABC subunit UvrC [bacterium]